LRGFHLLVAEIYFMFRKRGKRGGGRVQLVNAVGSKRGEREKEQEI